MPTVTLAMIRYISDLCAGIKKGSGALRIVELQNYFTSVHNFDSLHVRQQWHYGCCCVICCGARMCERSYLLSQRAHWCGPNSRVLVGGTHDFLFESLLFHSQGG